MGEFDEGGSAAYALIEAHELRHFDMARPLIEEYAAQLNVDLSFQDLATELERLADMYGPPAGALVLAMRGAEAVGCGAIRRLAEDACEMKRLYVRPNARGAGLGGRIALHVVERARALGYARMLLDTMSDMTAARSLYRSLGFRETAPYYANPLPGIVYLELDLRMSARIS